MIRSQHLHRGATGAVHVTKPGKTPIMTARCCRRLLFFKIEVRPRSCRSYHIWRPCNTTFSKVFYESAFTCIHSSFFVFRIPWHELSNYPNWAFLYLYRMFLPFLGLSSIALKIIIQNGKHIRRELLDSQTRNNSPIQCA